MKRYLVSATFTLAVLLPRLIFPQLSQSAGRYRVDCFLHDSG